jgi:hypothetical protein
MRAFSVAVGASPEILTLYDIPFMVLGTVIIAIGELHDPPMSIA